MSKDYFWMITKVHKKVPIFNVEKDYFWVVTKFSEINADITLRVYSSATIIMGITVFICVWLTSLFVL